MCFKYLLIMGLIIYCSPPRRRVNLCLKFEELHEFTWFTLTVPYLVFTSTKDFSTTTWLMTECSKSLIPNYIEDVVSCGLGFTFALFLEICYFNILMHSHPHARLINIVLSDLNSCVFEDFFPRFAKADISCGAG